MWAIISDIHSNYEALLAVADDIERHSVDEVICLGDIVGNGPNPCECVDLVMGCDVVIRGNEDQNVVCDPVFMSKLGARWVPWTRDELGMSDAPPNPWWKFLSGLPLSHKEGDFFFVHASPATLLIGDSLSPMDVGDSKKVKQIFE